eukprot:301556_1
MMNMTCFEFRQAVNPGKSRSKRVKCKKQPCSYFPNSKMTQKSTLIVLLNVRSGGCESARFAEEMKCCGAQVFSLHEFSGSPELLEELRLSLTLYNASIRVVIAGGDGTVSWGLQVMKQALALVPQTPSSSDNTSSKSTNSDQLCDDSTICVSDDSTQSSDISAEPVQTDSPAKIGKSSPEAGARSTAILPPIAVFPLGTGNELSRCLGWGISPTRLQRMMCDGRWGARVFRGDLVGLDRWRVEIFECGTTRGGPDTSKSTTDMECDKSHIAGSISTADDVVPAQTKFMYCFLSFGLDAKIAHKFHLHRSRKGPKYSPSVFTNNMWHAWYGLGEVLPHQEVLRNVIRVRVDGKPITLPPKIRILNIMNIYSSGKHDLIKPQQPNRKLDSEDFDAKSASPSDGVLELVASRHLSHYISNQMSLTHPIRLAQGSRIEVDVLQAIHMQLDGEPILIQPCRMVIRFEDTLSMVRGDLVSRFKTLR